ncbi:MAG TPA: ion transporter [Acidimicrobiia bacterium]|jgi:voltage-gated potassium channel
MVEDSGSQHQAKFAYSIFILVLTVFSLFIMVALLLPVSQATTDLLLVYDNTICVVFLIDFFLNLRRAERKGDYFFKQRGWLDLLGSIPALGFFRFTVLFRLARISRLIRISRLLSGSNRRQLINDIVKNRGEYAGFVTVLTAFMVLVLASILVIQFESKSVDANITTGRDALWWALVTITTVGYGDRFPVTTAGRITGGAVMFAGIGIIGALASILASILIPSPKEGQEEAGTADQDALRQELALIKAELSALRVAVLGERGTSP